MKKCVAFPEEALTDFWFQKKGGGVGPRSRPRLRLRALMAHSPKFVCDALDRSPDAERLGHLQDTNTLRKPLSHLAFSRAVYLRPTELHALGDGALEACFDALANHTPLKFSKGACYLENELAHWCRCVDGLLV